MLNHRSIETISNAICELNNTTKEQVFCKTRKREILFIRYLIYGISSEFLYNKKGITVMAAYSGQDHSTVSAALKTTRQLLSYKNGFASQYYYTVGEIIGDKSFLLRQERTALKERLKEIELQLHYT